MGYCDMFHVEKFLEEHGTATIGKKLVKTLMYFGRLSKATGMHCNIPIDVEIFNWLSLHRLSQILLLWANGDELEERRSISTIPGFTYPAGENSSGPLSGSEPQRSISAPPPTLVKAASICAHKMGVSQSPGLSAAKNTMSSFCKPSLDHESDKGIMDMMKCSGENASVANNVQDAQGYKFLSTSFGPSQEVDQGMLSQSAQMSAMLWIVTGSRSCEMPSEAHVQCYTHRQGTLTISVKKLLEILLPGEKEGKIWMWHRCLNVHLIIRASLRQLEEKGCPGAAWAVLGEVSRT
ncbi:hypothetical protein HAX54_025547 [Datura stramonium]|uniref:Uncharacterized protein n=1 Tax=Datura stramonium TaxID=4076 RepID=A0ABS8S699_DATST|nr:hypothetical protein [Datura stramonium]